MMPQALRRDFDHVIANPPYYPRGGTPSPDSGRARALSVDTPLADWVAAAARRLAPGGWLTLICGADGLPQVLGALAPKLGSAVVLPLAAREGRPALRVVLRARKGGRAGFRLLSPLVLHKGPVHDGDRESYTARAEEILRGGRAPNPRRRPLSTGSADCRSLPPPSVAWRSRPRACRGNRGARERAGLSGSPRSGPEPGWRG